MSYGPIKAYLGQVASGASTVNFDLSKSYSRIYVDVGTMSTGVNFDAFGSFDGTTYRPYMERVKTAPVQYQTMFVSAGVGANGGIVEFQFNPRYLQLRGTAVVSGGVSFIIGCID